MENKNVAYCGLYCGACKSFIKGKCKGCYENENASWCQIRKCCKEHNYTTCAECTITSLKDCKKYNNFIAKIIGYLTRTERSKCIDRIKIIGIDKFALEMQSLKKMSIKK